MIEKTLSAKEILEAPNLGLPFYAYSKHDFDIEEYIHIIRFMPDYIMNLSGLVIPDYITNLFGLVIPDYYTSDDDDDFYKVFNGLKRQSIYTALWLEVIILHRNSLRGRLEKPGKKEYEFMARESKAILELTTEICNCKNWFDKEYLSPKNWWLACERELTLQALENGGLMGEPLAVGAGTNYEQIRNNDKKIENPSPSDQKQEYVYTLTPLQCLLNLGIQMSTVSDCVDEKFKKYRDVAKSSARSLSLPECTLSPTYVINGKRQQSGKGKGFSRKKKKK